jgi:pimeloyl-ACP methyl ester carboxylesterase
LEFINRLGLSEFDLLGTSRGGAVAMCLAAECVGGAGPRIAKLVLACPVNPYSPHGKRLAPFFATRVGQAIFHLSMGTVCSRFSYPYIHGRLYADRSKIPPGSLQGYIAPLAMPGLFDHALSIVQTWTADLKELEALLPRLRETPTLLMWGEKDPAVYVSSLEPLARHFANVKKVVFPEIGHLPYEECAEDFNRELIRFLTQGPEVRGRGSGIP